MKECWLCPVFASFTLVFALQLRRKHGKTSVRVKKNLSQVKRNLSQGTVCILPKHSHAYILPKHPHKLPKHPHYYQNTHMYTYYQNTHTNYQNTHTITKTPTCIHITKTLTQITKTPTLLPKHPHYYQNTHTITKTPTLLPKHPHVYILPKHPHYYQNTHMYTYYQNTHTNYQNTHTITKTPTLLSKHPHTFGNRLPIDMVSPLENGVLNHKRHFFDAKNEFKKSYILPLQRTKRRQYLNRNQHGNCSSKKCSMYHFQSKHFNNAVTDHTSTA